ncbi:hypothetical protein BAE44_0013886 [Dichanthelium oligosanthes]|uniref:DUF4283 domain-containing protein n=1 Tax=Dichanthelium oligosanthes TaxID=888268 RepID=A0A1E5VJ14_9POAL|nr:hypothetical protein BAE44_0013886 [Dichanthelium oligosanthes]
MLVLRRFGPSSFLLILPSTEAAERVYNGGRPIIINPFIRLHVMRWTRFLHSNAASLPFPVEIELRGIPAHAWEVKTVEQLLSDFCWITDSHLDSDFHRDVFKVVAWCSCPERILAEMELEIVEPVMTAGGEPRRAPSYSIGISVASFILPAARGTPPSPPPATAAAQGGTATAVAPGGAPRLSALAGSAPQANAAGHVAAMRTPAPPCGASGPPAAINDLPALFLPEATAASSEQDPASPIASASLGAIKAAAGSLLLEAPLAPADRPGPRDASSLPGTAPMVAWRTRFVPRRLRRRKIATPIPWGL